MLRDILIIGSCVTRDAFSIIRNEYKILDYFARTSLASAFQLAPFRWTVDELDPARDIKSQFQRRVVERDLTKSLRQTLSDLNPETVIVVDLIDERFGLLLDQGSLATYSAELQLAKPLARHPSMTTIPPYSDRHFSAWIDGADSLVELVKRKKLNVIINKAYWAEASVGGHVFPREQVARSNATLACMYGTLQAKLRCPAITYESFAADDKHKWGLSAFHYTEATYRIFVEQLDMFCAAIESRISQGAARQAA